MSTNTHVILLPLVFVSVFLNAIHVSSKQNEGLLLSCGLADGVANDTDGRKWESDAKYLSGGSKSITSRASYQDPSLQAEVPYMTARIFTSETTYKLPTKPNQHYWLRLHFYPSTYDSQNPSDAYFSVTSNGITLLSNFSAYVTCQALSQAYIAKEYSLAPSNSDSLSVTFKPSDKHNGAYAFVNGIELIPVPELFNESAVLVGFSDQTIVANTSNLETMFRLNVGGQYISPINDSGLSRTWYDDTPYIFGAAIGITSEAKNVKVDYKMPEYVAPPDVYSTSRSMGVEKNVNKNFNLTWIFQVDANFTYLVRLHFCDYRSDKVNQVVFSILLNNQTAEATADVIAWSGGKAVPVYKDYAVYVKDGPGDETLQVDLRTNEETKPEFLDAFLNGVEVFKMNDTSGNLAGPNPQPSAMLVKAEEQLKSFQQAESPNKAKVIGTAAGGAAGFAVVAALCIAVYHRKKRVPGADSHTSSWLPLYGNSHTSGNKSTISGKSNGSSHVSAMAQGLSRHFSLAEILHATKKFDESNVIGVGGFGKVYKGVIDDGTKVAIKRSNPSSEQGVNEFQTEIEMLSKLRHKHLVSLIGFCEEGEEMCLVYDYMAKGTLREHLYKGSKTQLSWKQRLEICIGAARGLHYLHTGAKYTIIHRDVKTTNILLDENWVAKVSDFGLSKTGPDLNQGHVSTVVKGSFGYLDPEYFRRQQLTEKSDVYSFGVVLFEVLCARPALNPNLAKEQVSLADWALQCKRKGTLEDIIDPQLKGKINPESMIKFADAAEKCLSDHGLDRPSMNDLLWNLEFALNLQENTEGSSHSSRREESEFEEISLSNQDQRAMHLSKLSLGGEDEMSKESSDSSGAIFSQIVNPKGR
ncbi:Receptor-like protein kinase [Quillaja saponaria]|uniref:non-specific serine/threonine protein kinase n=1 Tax=Quillaja saponaria TaxID=32244 RepID=A0AAD7Q2A1_QUISA|nr:Receptor-like protein kinase [Quillaja saponaria]